MIRYAVSQTASAYYFFMLIIIFYPLPQKPTITFFGEKVCDATHKIHLKSDLKKCDLVLVVGTSLQVGGVVMQILGGVKRCVPQILINLHDVLPPSSVSEGFDVSLLGACDDVVGYICRHMTWGGGDSDDSGRHESNHKSDSAGHVAEAIPDRNMKELTVSSTLVDDKPRNKRRGRPRTVTVTMTGALQATGEVEKEVGSKSNAIVGAAEVREVKRRGRPRLNRTTSQGCVAEVKRFDIGMFECYGKDRVFRIVAKSEAGAGAGAGSCVKVKSHMPTSETERTPVILTHMHEGEGVDAGCALARSVESSRNLTDMPAGGGGGEEERQAGIYRRIGTGEGGVSAGERDREFCDDNVDKSSRKKRMKVSRNDYIYFK